MELCLCSRQPQRIAVIGFAQGRARELLELAPVGDTGRLVNKVLFGVHRRFHDRLLLRRTNTPTSVANPANIAATSQMVGVVALEAFKDCSVTAVGRKCKT